MRILGKLNLIWWYLIMIYDIRLLMKIIAKRWRVVTPNSWIWTARSMLTIFTRTPLMAQHELGQKVGNRMLPLFAPPAFLGAPLPSETGNQAAAAAAAEVWRLLMQILQSNKQSTCTRTSQSVFFQMGQRHSNQFDQEYSRCLITTRMSSWKWISLWAHKKTS